MHYPPIKKNTDEVVSSNYVEILKENKVKTCIYGHLHGKAHEEAFEGDYEGINFKLVSADYLDFKLYKVKLQNNERKRNERGRYRGNNRIE